MWRVYGGAIVIIGGIAAFIDAHRHIPVPARRPEIGLITPASGLSPTAYDLLRIGGWALVILGGVTVALGLISYAMADAATKPLATTEISANGASRREKPPATIRTPDPRAVEATQPWGEGSHGEAVEPNPRR
jgi:hypothetical protein